jgi:hypothetical protein
LEALPNTALGKNFCLPTTCGYQFVYNKGARTQLGVDAFFAMNGLGMAMRIEHGIGHHFMGAMFTHNTCLPVCWNAAGQMTICNIDNNLRIIGWGTSGGFREVSEHSTRRARANVADIVGAANARAVSEATNAREQAARAAAANARAAAAEEEVDRLKSLVRAQGLDLGML